MLLTQTEGIVMRMAIIFPQRGSTVAVDSVNFASCMMKAMIFLGFVAAIVTAVLSLLLLEKSEEQTPNYCD